MEFCASLVGIAVVGYLIANDLNEFRLDVVIFFLCLYAHTIGTLTATAVIACTAKRIRGEQVSPGDGWKAVMGHLEALLAPALCLIGLADREASQN